MKINEILQEETLNKISDERVRRFSRIQKWDDLDAASYDKGRFAKVYDEFQERIKTGGGVLRIWRAFSLYGDPIEALSKNDTVGIFWTYDRQSARVYRGGDNPWEETYIMETRIREELIDWDATLLHAMTPVRSDYEREVRLYKGTPIRLDRLYHKDGNKEIEIDLGPLRSKVFRARRVNK